MPNKHRSDLKIFRFMYPNIDNPCMKFPFNLLPAMNFRLS